MSTGYITVKVFTAERAMPVPKTQIRIIDLRIALDQTIYTDSNGNAERIKVYAPDKATSLKPQDMSSPYETYNIEIMKEGYIPTVINNVPVFAGETCVQPVAMIPQPEGQNFANLVNNIEIPPNGLQLKTEKRPPAAPNPSKIKQVFIPDFIRVHLGEPDSDSKTVLVPFCEYIKNVASSEIYATWPEESLIANILAIISFALNRIYTGFYPAQGKNFDITSMPERDPFFVEGRNIYGNICDIVDGIFNMYIKRTGFDEPLLANYCNGITTRCEGISQWGSVTLANQGQSAEDILKYYYGNVQTETTKDIKGVEKGFPGGLLRLGDVGENVMAMQKQLNQIGKTYSNIPNIPKENGNFDAYTQDAVLAFQKQFNLNPDGIVGKKTWYQIGFAYNNVKRLQNLSKMRSEMTIPSVAPTSTLRAGSTGADVRLLQYLLLAAGIFYNSIFPVEVSGTYDQATEAAVRSFQKTFALPQTGNADKTTWNALLNVYNGIEKQVGTVLDNLQGPGEERTGEKHMGNEDKKMQAPEPAPMGMRRPAVPEQHGQGEMARSRKGDESPGRPPVRDDMRSANEERIRAAMNYANQDYKILPRGTMNMAYSSDIKDYVPESGMRQGLEYPWTHSQTEPSKEQPSGPKTGNKEPDKTRMGDAKPAQNEPGQKKDTRPPENQRFQYTPWMADSQTGMPPMGSGGMDQRNPMGEQESKPEGQPQTGGRDMNRSGVQSGAQETPKQNKPWMSMDDTMSFMRNPGLADQGIPSYPYMTARDDDETMISRPGTKVTPHRPEINPDRWGTTPAEGPETDRRPAPTNFRPEMQQDERILQGRQTYPMRMPGMPSGMPGQAGAVPPDDDGDEAYTCPDPPYADPVYPNVELKIGSKGNSVQLMQEYLSYIALSLMRYKMITSELKVVVNDGIYGIDTTDAVIRFQNRYEMPVNGVIDAATWAKIVEVYNNPCE